MRRTVQRPNRPAPVQPILLPDAGPFHVLVLLLTAIIQVGLAGAYVLGTALLGITVGHGLYRDVCRLLASNEAVTPAMLDLVPVSLAAMGWWIMLRPLFAVAPRPTGAMQVTASTQPRLFGLLEEICAVLRLPIPVEVWLDCTVSVRAWARRGTRGLRDRDIVLFIGMPAVAALTSRALAALAVRELSHFSGRFAARLRRFVREMERSGQRACHWRDPWEDRLAGHDHEDPSFKNLRRALRLFIWLWQRPFWALATSIRAVSHPAMRLMERRADSWVRQMMGDDGFLLLSHKQRLLQQALGRAGEELAAEAKHGRLPDNFAMLVARHFVRALGAETAPIPRCARSDAASSSRLIDTLPAEADATDWIHDFSGLSGQLSQLFYQHGLGIAVHKQQLIPVREPVSRNLHDVEALVAIRSYFRGLMHPERSLCGLVATFSRIKDPRDLIPEVAGGRQWERLHGPGMRAALREWDSAWQRRRDLEAAWVLALAGIPVCRLDLGGAIGSPEVLRSAAARQKMIMDHLDDPLKICEARLERRLTAALGLLWWSPPGSLPGGLDELRRQLPLWGSVHESLAHVLAEFRELLTSHHSFKILGTKIGLASDPGALVTAFQAVVPGMVARCQSILKALDGAVYPFGADGKVVSLQAYLLPTPPDWLDANSLAGLGMHERARCLASGPAQHIGPFIERFLELYHRSLAWLAAAAAQSESHFVGWEDHDGSAEPSRPSAAIVNRAFVLS